MTGARVARGRRSRWRLVAYALAGIAVGAWGLVVWRTLQPPVWIPTPPSGIQDMVRCPAGTLPARPGRPEKRIEAVYVDRFEVTCADYGLFLQATGLPFRRLGWPSNKPPPELQEHPVTSVTLTEARQYADWRGKRIPTNDEWEWCARGEFFQEWPWGSAVRVQVANTAEIGYGTTCPVGLFEEGRSPFGAYDMVGNVAEWTEGPVPLTMELEPRYFVRGGSFLDRLTEAGMGLLETHVLSETDGGAAEWVVRRHRISGADGYSSDTGFRCAIDASVIDEERAVCELVRRLGGRDAWTWWFEVRPALAELERLGIEAEQRRRERAPRPPEEAWRRLGEEGADVLAILRYAEGAVEDEGIRSRLGDLISRIEDGSRAAE